MFINDLILEKTTAENLELPVICQDPVSLVINDKMPRTVIVSNDRVHPTRGQ